MYVLCSQHSTRIIEDPYKENITLFITNRILNRTTFKSKEPPHAVANGRGLGGKIQ